MCPSQPLAELMYACGGGQIWVHETFQKRILFSSQLLDLDEDTKTVLGIVLSVWKAWLLAIHNPCLSLDEQALKVFLCFTSLPIELTIILACAR